MKIKGAPCIHKVLLGAAGGGQPGPLAHGMAIIRAETQDALQPLSHPGNTGQRFHRNSNPSRRRKCDDYA